MSDTFNYLVNLLCANESYIVDSSGYFSVHIRSYSGPYFSPPFGLNTDRCFVSLRIKSECRKIRTRITLNMDTFYVVLWRRFRDFFDIFDLFWNMETLSDFDYCNLAGLSQLTNARHFSLYRNYRHMNFENTPSKARIILI